MIHETGRDLPRTTINLAVNALIAAPAAGNGIVDQNAARSPITEVTATPEHHSRHPGHHQPHRKPPGGVFHSPDVLKISVATILKINVALQALSAD